MSDAGHNVDAQLRSIVERVERLHEERKALGADIADVFREAKANGFDVKALKAVISYRAKDKTEREEHDAIVALYLSRLGVA